MNSTFISVTGQRLELGCEAENQGQFAASNSKAIGTPFINAPGQCLPISSFEKLNQLGEGTYGVVYRARNKKNSQVVALKQVRISPEDRQNGIPITALREISILRSLRHNNIINVSDVAVGETEMDEIYLVMEYAEQVCRGYSTPVDHKVTPLLVKCLCRQLLEGLDYLQKNDIIHRWGSWNLAVLGPRMLIQDYSDIKMQNILLTAKGVLKIADFGMARAYSARPITPGVVTIWYRSPELLLGTKYYTPSVDIWSAGLVLAELLQSSPCLTGDSEIHQLSLIVKLIGSPTPDDIAALAALGCPQLIQWRRESGIMSGRADNVSRRFLKESTPETVNFLSGCLKWDPSKRWTAAEALGRGKTRLAKLAEAWWKESPRAVNRELLPTFPEVRNGVPTATSKEWDNDIGGDAAVAEATANQLGKSKMSTGGPGEGYVFDFDGDAVRRAAKRVRPR